MWKTNLNKTWTGWLWWVRQKYCQKLGVAEVLQRKKKWQTKWILKQQKKEKINGNWKQRINWRNERTNFCNEHFSNIVRCSLFTVTLVVLWYMVCFGIFLIIIFHFEYFSGFSIVWKMKKTQRFSVLKP